MILPTSARTTARGLPNWANTAAELIAYGLQDGSNEIDDYSNQLYEPVNPELELAGSGNDGLVDPNAYQPLAIPVFVSRAMCSKKPRPSKGRKVGLSFCLVGLGDDHEEPG